MRAACIATATTIAITLSAVASAAPLSPFSKGPYLQELSSHGVVVRAEVEPPGPMSVRVEAAGKVLEGKDDGASAMHSIRIEGLHPKTAYRYTVTASGAKAQGTFTTAPPDDDTAPITFLVYGDNRTDAVQHAAIVRAMESEPSDLLVHTGDFVDDGGQPPSWQTFFDVESPLLRDRCLFSTVGNHELTDAQGSAYLQFFGSERAQTDHRLDETIRWGMIRFFFLNGWGSLAYGADRDWLDKALADSDREQGIAWRFLVVHHGPYSSSLHGPNERFQTAELEPLLQKHKIDMVISGHDHVYERGASGLLRYVVSGGGGAPLYPVGAPLPQTRRAMPAYHFIRFSVTPDKVSIVVKRPDATQIEAASFSAKSDRAWDDDPGPVAKPSASPPAASPKAASPPSAKAEDKCGCQLPGGPAPSRSALGVGVVAAFALLRRRLRVASRAR